MGERWLLVLVNERAVNVLVPKQRGEGFLKVPFGHNRGPLSAVEAEIGFDMSGLDGDLFIETGHTYGRREDLLKRIMPPLAAHYKLPWREVDKEEFYRLHPVAIALPTPPEEQTDG